MCSQKTRSKNLIKKKTLLTNFCYVLLCPPGCAASVSIGNNVQDAKYLFLFAKVHGFIAQIILVRSGICSTI